VASPAAQPDAAVVDAHPRPLRVALVAPVAQPVPPPRSGSIEILTATLANGLVSRGCDVTLFATGGSTTKARLHATYERGYLEDPTLWPWELCELLNLSAAVERAAAFDVIHYQAEYAPLALGYAALSAVPLLQTVHHLPSPSEVAHWSRYPNAPFVAVSHEQARVLSGLRVLGTIHHAVDTDAYRFQAVPDDYLLFLGRFTAGKGVLQAIEVARRTGHRLVLAAAENDYYREQVAPHVDGRRVVYAGEVHEADKVALLGGARALLYPLQSGESFGLVLAEAASCGTPAAALRRGAVAELIDTGIGAAFDSLDELVDGLPGVLALDRAAIRARAVERFGVERMVSAYLALYAAVAGYTIERR
jgi:glycosyltransferase involved in cell wall biosynthesis